MKCYICKKYLSEEEVEKVKRWERGLNGDTNPPAMKVKANLPIPEPDTDPDCVDKFGGAIVCEACISNIIDTTLGGVSIANYKV
jgi:hypothetical protein